MKRIVWILISVFSIVSCSKDNFTIEGKITNSNSSMIYLEKLGIDGTSSFDSSIIANNGDFKLSGKVSYPTFFLLKLNNQKMITLLIDSLEKVNISADFINFSKDYKVEGSLGTHKVKELNDRLAQTNMQIDSLQALLSYSVNDKDFKIQKGNWISELETVYAKQQDFSKIFVEKNPFSLASVLAIFQKFNNGNYVLQDLQTIKMAASALNSMYPNSVHSQTLYKYTEKLVKDIRAKEVQNFIEIYGQNSPEVILPDVNGKEIPLSSLKGKYVLVHFWASNDPSSRVMNEVLRENYLKYNAQGFEIYQISIDTIKEEWRKAIAEDKLSWTNVGDMQGSMSAVSSFNITKVPSNYLLDKDGSILAKDLKGPALYSKLNEILN